jgi:DNA-binding Xre family transcriptional regulator
MALTRLETRKRLNRVDMDMIAKLCAFYGVEIRELLEYSPEDIETPSFTAAVTW